MQAEHRQARHESLWIADTEEPSFGVPEGPVEVDAAVLGAGIAGLTTALLLKNAGLRVAVLEADGICRATAGHTTAKVSAQAVDLGEARRGQTMASSE